MANFLKGRTNENLVKGHDVGATGIATGTTSERPSDSNTGDIRFNTDNNVLEFYNQGLHPVVFRQNYKGIPRLDFVLNET